MMKITVDKKYNLFNDVCKRERKSINNTFGNFLQNQGLYDEIEITKENIFELADLMEGCVKLDLFCPKCGEKRVFSGEMIPLFLENDERRIYVRSLGDEVAMWQLIQNTDSPGEKIHSNDTWSWTNDSLEYDTRLMVFRFLCGMDNSHHLDFIVLTYGNKMKKIGQFPSVADLTFPELKEYRKVFPKEDEKELKRAIGLFASGIGVGSFVYLRRIYERIIISAGKKAIEEGKIEQEKFEKSRVDERTKMLHDYLPKQLVGNHTFYGILSKGIHELSEEQCLEYFPVLKSFIIMILRQWENERRDKEEKKELDNQLSNIVGKI